MRQPLYQSYWTKRHRDADVMRGGIANKREMKMPRKISIVRFKPKPECFDEFLQNIQDWHAQVFADGDHRLMRTNEEVVAIVVRESEQLQENMKRGVFWLDSQRPLLQEYNEVDRHTLPMTGDLVI